MAVGDVNPGDPSPAWSEQKRIYYASGEGGGIKGKPHPINEASKLASS